MYMYLHIHSIQIIELNLMHKVFMQLVLYVRKKIKFMLTCYGDRKILLL